MAGYNSRCGLESVVSYNSNSGGAGYQSRGYNGGIGSSGIDYMIAAESNQFEPAKFYIDTEGIGKEVYQDGYKTSKRVSETYSHSIDHFLNPARALSAFVGDAKEIQEFAEEAFRELTGKEFPDDIVINLISEEEMKKMHPRNVVGFAINRKKQGLVSDVFVKKDTMDRVMVILGHELGHALTTRLQNERDEEAKAFAFSLAWMKIIKEKNIANLSTAILLDRPAQNGVHDVALDFVLNEVKKGKEAFGLWEELAQGLINVGDSKCQEIILNL